MTDLNRLVRLVSMLLCPLGLLLFLKQFYLSHIALTEAVPTTVAAMIGMIPEGLILLTSVALAVGVVRLGGKGTLVQELYGIETLARVDTLCLDKTGTLTKGEMAVERLDPVGCTEADMRRELGRFLSAFDDPTPTLEALRRAIVPVDGVVTGTLPFSSARKKSAVAFDDGTVLVLGAPSFVMEGRAARPGASAHGGRRRGRPAGAAPGPGKRRPGGGKHFRAPGGAGPVLPLRRDPGECRGYPGLFPTSRSDREGHQRG